MKRYYVIYKGIVQGVGFRWKLNLLANKYDLTGWVKNLDNGNVELMVQGEKVDIFLEQSLKDDRFIRIDDYQIKEIEPVENEKQFRVIF